MWRGGSPVAGPQRTTKMGISGQHPLGPRRTSFSLSLSFRWTSYLLALAAVSKAILAGSEKTYPLRLYSVHTVPSGEADALMRQSVKERGRDEDLAGRRLTACFVVLVW
jgi:hypothetical protein